MDVWWSRGAKAKHYNGRHFNAFRAQCSLAAAQVFICFHPRGPAEVGNWDTSILASKIYGILASDVLGYNVAEKLGGSGFIALHWVMGCPYAPVESYAELWQAYSSSSML